VNYDEHRAHDATGLAKLVADKDVTAAELLTLARERAAAVNPRINAIVRDVPASPSDELDGPFAGRRCSTSSPAARPADRSCPDCPLRRSRLVSERIPQAAHRRAGAVGHQPDA
jgi:hypothetical protein